MGGNRIFLSPTHQNQAYCSTFLFTETDTHSMHVTIRLRVEMEAGGRITNPLNYLKWFFFYVSRRGRGKNKPPKKTSNRKTAIKTCSTISFMVTARLLKNPVPKHTPIP